MGSILTMYPKSEKTKIWLTHLIIHSFINTTAMSHYFSNTCSWLRYNSLYRCCLLLLCCYGNKQTPKFQWLTTANIYFLLRLRIGCKLVGAGFCSVLCISSFWDWLWHAAVDLAKPCNCMWSCSPIMAQLWSVDVHVTYKKSRDIGKGTDNYK